MLVRGTHVDRYRIEGPLGRGGMGEVYIAIDERLRRPVALKTLMRGGDPTVEQRFVREARAAALLTHPNAVVVYDVGEQDDLVYMAMELVQGTTLRVRIGEPGLATKLAWMVDVGHVLVEAHRLGLVHRDVKPENVMIRRDGLVKVLDFGTVKRLVREDSRETSLTGEGVVLGTPKYMPPEGFDGLVTPAVDQFAWGVVTYELLTAGKHPLAPPKGTPRLEWLARAEPVPIRERRPEIPAAVEAVVMRTMARDPAARFADMSEAVAALSVCLEEARRAAT